MFYMSRLNKTKLVLLAIFHPPVVQGRVDNRSFGLVLNNFMYRLLQH